MATHATRAAPARRPQKPLWRRLLRAALVLFAVLASPVIAFLIWNAIDESPTPAALRFDASQARPVADADNAWLMLAGAGAAADDDPIALARRRVDAVVARISQLPTPEATAAEKALFVDSVPAVNPDPVQDGVAELCLPREQNCLQWASEHRALLLRLREANALRLQRFEAALALPEWQVLYPPEGESIYADTTVAQLHANLIALELAEGAALALDPGGSHPLQRLAISVEFWRRVRIPPQDVWTILVSGNQIEQAYLIADAWLDRANKKQIEAQSNQMEKLLARPVAEVDWSLAMHNDFRTFARGMQEALPGVPGTLSKCFAGKATDGCLTMLSGELAYAPQATLNLHAMHREQMQRVLEASPADLDAVSKEAGAVIADSFPQLEDVGALLPQLAYNFVGRILAGIAIPAYDWGKREHDREALRRLLLIKLKARQAGIEAAAMPEHVQAQASALLNPWTGNPFEWDAEHGVLHFTPKAAGRWKQPRVELRYGADVD
ncbi:MAG: hypothetical protein ACT4NL_06850 [Pseudomarimonas sp.]